MVSIKALVKFSFEIPHTPTTAQRSIAVIAGASFEISGFEYVAVADELKALRAKGYVKYTDPAGNPLIDEGSLSLEDLAAAVQAQVQGGGGGVSVVDADPISPVQGDVWIKRNPPVAGTDLQATVNLTDSTKASPAPILFTVPNTNPADMAAFSDGTTQRITIDPSSGVPGGTVNVTAAVPAQGLHVVYGTGPGTPTTFADLKSAVDAWATANQSYAHGITNLQAPIEPDTIGSNGTSVLSASSTPEAMTLKVQGSSKVFSLVLT